MKKVLRATAAVLGFVSLFVPGAVAEAAEIRVLANPGMKSVFEQLVPQFEKRTGHRLLIQYGLMAQLKGPIDAGEFDVAVSTGPVTDYLNQQGRTAADTRVAIARVGIGVSVRAGAPRPDIGTVNAFKRALLNAKSISYTGGSAAGTYIAGMLERLGIAEEMKPKTRITGGGGQNPKAVAAGEVELGLSIMSDIVPVPGAVLLGPLPEELQTYIVETAAISAASKEPQAAEALIKFLREPTAAVVFKAEGMEPMRP
jgi:molybdate transport system substrate-binding protein